MNEVDRIAVLSLALRRIRGERCSRYYTGTACRFEKHLRPTAKYGADRWCDACIAADALDKAARLARKAKA